MFRRDYPLALVTSLGVGGPADFYINPKNNEEIIAALKFARTHNYPVTVIGYGTNLLVRAGGIRGVVIQIAEYLATAQVKGNTIYATTGCLFGSIAKLAYYHNLSGLEFATGIPGGIGGAVFMNAGAYGGEIGPLLHQVDYVTADGPGCWSKDEFTYAYRTSRVQQERVIVTGITLEMTKGDPQEILAKMDDFQNQRRSKQPLEYPSAGSTFKRPAGHYVGPMIEQAGLKGFCIGGAEVSTKHAGFIINKGGASATDFLRLIEHIQNVIKNQFGVDLEPEIRLLGTD